MIVNAVVMLSLSLSLAIHRVIIIADSHILFVRLAACGMECELADGLLCVFGYRSLCRTAMKHCTRYPI